jgi:hypothetical protein
MANLQRFASLALISVLAACGGNDTEDVASKEALDAPALEGTASPMDTMLHSTIPLEALAGSGVTGEAMAMHAEEAVVVILELRGLTPGAAHPAHIHSGSCADGGPVAVPLTSITGLEDGTGASTTSIGSADISPSQAYFIQVHATDGTPVACGGMEGHGSS